MSNLLNRNIIQKVGLAVILGVVLFSGSYILNHQFEGIHLADTKISEPKATHSTLKTNSLIKPPANPPAPAGTSVNNGVVVTDFYSCWQKVGSLSASKPAHCSYNGTTYAAPSTFDKSQIAHLDTVPSGAQPLVIALAQKTFDRCPTVAFQPSIQLAQWNFVIETVGCDSGFGEYFGLDNGTWHDLGSGQMGLSCAYVDTYQIKKSSFVDASAPPEGFSCYTTDGTLKQIP